MTRLIAFALLIPAATPQPQVVDYTTCQIIPNGPITPEVQTHHMWSDNGAAKVSSLA